jgi:hypothetical protein
VLSGWIKIHRKILDHWVSQEPELLAMWVRLLSEANHADSKRMFNGSLIEVKRGQLIFGLNAFSAKSGISVAKLRRYLKMLESDNMISKQNASKYSLITITCFDKHQSIDKQTTSKQQADDKQTTSKEQHRKNVKNEKECREDNTGDKSPLPENKFSDDDMKAASWMLEKILEIKPNCKLPNLNDWADTIRLIRQRDDKTHKEIAELFRWANNDDFWRLNILSPAKLRKQWDALEIKMTNQPSTEKRNDFSQMNYGTEIVDL